MPPTATLALHGCVYNPIYDLIDEHEKLKNYSYDQSVPTLQIQQPVQVTGMRVPRIIEPTTNLYTIVKLSMRETSFMHLVHSFLDTQVGFRCIS